MFGGSAIRQDGSKSEGYEHAALRLRGLIFAHFTITPLRNSRLERTAHVAANHPVVSFEHTVYVGFSAGIP